MAAAFDRPEITVLDIRQLDNEDFAKTVYGALTPERRKKADEMRFEKDRRLCAGAGYLLSQGFSRYGVRDTTLFYGPHQKPYLNPSEGLFFSLSHSGLYAVCAFYHQDVGIDIQQQRAVSAELMQYVCTPKEWDHLQALPEQDRTRRFFRIWTVKESYLKYLGCGLSLSPQTLCTDFSPTPRIFREGMAAPVVFQCDSLDGHPLTVCYPAPLRPEL